MRKIPVDCRVPTVRPCAGVPWTAPSVPTTPDPFPSRLVARARDTWSGWCPRAAGGRQGRSEENDPCAQPGPRDRTPRLQEVHGNSVRPRRGTPQGLGRPRRPVPCTQWTSSSVAQRAQHRLAIVGGPCGYVTIPETRAARHGPVKPRDDSLRLDDGEVSDPVVARRPPKRWAVIVGAASSEPPSGGGRGRACRADRAARLLAPGQPALGAVSTALARLGCFT